MRLFGWVRRLVPVDPVRALPVAKDDPDYAETIPLADPYLNNLPSLDRAASALIRANILSAAAGEYVAPTPSMRRAIRDALSIGSWFDDDEAAAFDRALWDQGWEIVARVDDLDQGGYVVPPGFVDWPKVQNDLYNPEPRT